LIEFEETLLDGAGSATTTHCFRVMDPLSHSMMGLRADMTPQVARIAVARLGSVPRPLRLSYSGDVLRVKGSQLSPERQSCQAGLELIGSDSLSADAEVLVLATAALEQVGVPDISVDLSLPTLVPMILAEAALSAEAEEKVRHALYHKDAAMVRDEGGAAAATLLALMEAAGSLDRALERLKSLSLPKQAMVLRDHLLAVVELIRRQAPGLALTLDPVENRGFEYHTGLAFTIFSRKGGGELGRGGRYLAGGNQPATGATLFLDGILAVAAKPVGGKSVYVPLEFVGEKAKTLRQDGWITVLGLEPTTNPESEAKRLGCTYVLGKNGPKAVDPKP
jgi:ATP phosphoribosyltransferase regulatory subunit